MAIDRLVPFKIFGLQRTGTNLIEALLTRNFRTKSLEIGSEWKHGQLRRPDRSWDGVPCKFVLCVKNPYAWLYSCYRYFQRSYDADDTIAPQFRANRFMPFDQFVRTPCYEFESPVHRWNQMHNHWLEALPLERTAIVRHEDQLDDQVRVLMQIEKQFGLGRKNAELKAIHRRVGVDARIQAIPMNVAYYRNHVYLKEYSPSLLRWVTERLSTPLLNRFAYGGRIAKLPTARVPTGN